MRVTIKDIAEQLNINKSTVSYALNGKGTVKEKTRELIQRTAREMGYIPNQSARQTSTGKSNEVAIVVPNVISIYGEFCEHAFQLLSDAGMRSSIYISEFSIQREEIIIQDLISKGVGGILIASSQEFETNTQALLKKHGIPVVYRSETSGHSSVGIDYRRIGILMGEKLQKTGKKHVCVASPTPPPFYSNISKIKEGLEEFLGDKAMVRVEYIPEEERTESTEKYSHIARQLLTPDWYDYHRKLFHKIFDSKEGQPDAIVSPTDSCIMTIKDEAEQSGIDIPKDLALISGTRSVASIMSHKDITSVYVPEKNIAETMVKQLLKKIENPGKVESILLKPEFYPGSTL